MGCNTHKTIERLLCIAPAHSSGLSPVGQHGTAPAQAKLKPAQEPAQEQAVWRYAYDASQRRVLSQQAAASQSDTTATTAATRRSQFQGNSHRLNMGVQASADTSAHTTYNANGQPERVGSREYVWDALGRLVEVREEVREEVRLEVRPEVAQKVAQNTGEQAAVKAGQPTQTTARYQYDHRGLRISKQLGQHTSHTSQNTTHTQTFTLYDESRQPLAELDAQGRIQRQYIWLADMPLAVIDSPATLSAQDTGLAQVFKDLAAAVGSWLHTDAGLAWLHTNHLGAPEAATNAQGQLIWRASYAPFGAAKVTAASNHVEAQGALFQLNLRLPGQMFDAETGLHYNRQRYYDPALGQYLTPDPLGTPDGPNPYAYVAFNPLGFIDPDGLVLFAFDGTGNSNDLNDPAMAGSSISNVWAFRNRYDDGNARYVTGVGTVHKDTEQNGGDIMPDDYARGKILDYLTGNAPLYVSDMGGNYSGPARIDRMMRYFEVEAKDFDKSKAMDIDIVGFSRGAAQARDFASRITKASTTINGKTFYKYKDDAGKEACQWVNFRFMGLFDTVLSTNLSDYSYQLGIPSQFSYVAQAVALNEHRSANLSSYNQRAPLPYSQQWGGFPLESIGATGSAAGITHIEMGFLGSHTDIGGGFADNELSKVALAWMVGQAVKAGVKMDETSIAVANSAVLHDKSNNIQTGKPVETCAVCTDGEDRRVNGAFSGNKQRTMQFGSGSNSMTYTDTQDARNNFITYRDTKSLERYTDADIWRPDIPSGIKGVNANMVDQIKTNVTGTVNIDGYVAWLKLNGYDLNQLQVQK